VIGIGVLLMGIIPGWSAGAQSPVEKGSSLPGRTRLTAEPRCILELEAPREILLGDGRIPYVAPVNLVRSGGRFLLMGGPAYVWERGAEASLLPVDSTGILGIVFTPEGSATLVRSPFDEGSHALYPRVAPRDDGGWYVLLVESDTSDFWPPQTRRTVLWLGVYDQGWQSLERVAEAHTHLLRPEQSSDLVIGASGDMAFAYAVGTDDLMGIVLLRRRSGRWHHDTLSVGRHVHHVDLRAGAEPGTWTVAFNPHMDRSVPVSTYSRIIGFGSTWGEQLPVIADELGMPLALRIHRIAGQWVGIWAVYVGDPTYFGVRWGALRPDRLLEGGAAGLISRPSTEFVAVPVDSTRIIVLTRTAAGAQGVAAHLVRHGRLEDLGVIAGANAVGPGLHVDPDGGMVMVTAEEGTEPGTPPVIMSARRMRLRC
jgi:hypothetical protein